MLPKEHHQLKYEAISAPQGSVRLVKKTQERKNSNCYLLITKGVTSSTPVPLKTLRVEERCTLNLSRAQTTSFLDWRATTLLLARDLAAVSGRRISIQTVFRHIAEAGLYTQHPVTCVPLITFNWKEGLLWSLKYQPWTPQEWRERGARSQPYYVTEIDRFGSKGILVWGSIVLGTVRVRCGYCQHVKLFWVLCTRNTFLWTVRCGHTELTPLMNFMKRILAAWIGPRRLLISIL
ncbi:hypothetical protein TNCV_4537261 [Trichonephila clavipes]|nr:hypothetical protein TNCV_4537261 [Trichonephila clavipes]